MKITLENAADALKQTEPLSSDAIKQYADLTHRRRLAIQERLAAIYSPDDNSADEWTTTNATGTDAEVKALREEYEAAETELDRVIARNDQFKRLAPVARQREAEQSLPAKLDALEKAQASATKAHQALTDAAAELDSAYEAAKTAFSEAARWKPSAPLPSASRELVGGLDGAAKALTFEPTGRLYSAQDSVARSLHYKAPAAPVEPLKDGIEPPVMEFNHV